MATNPITPDELVSSAAIERLQTLINKLNEVGVSLSGLKASIQSEAKSLQDQVQTTNMTNQSLEEMQRKVTSLNNALRDSKKAEEENRNSILAAKHELSMLMVSYEKIGAASREASNMEKAAHKERLSSIKAAFAEEDRVRKASEAAKRKAEAEYQADAKRMIAEEARIRKEEAAIEKQILAEVAAEEKKYQQENMRLLKEEEAARKAAHVAKQAELRAVFAEEAEMKKLAAERARQIGLEEVEINVEKMLAGQLKVTELSYNQLSAMYSLMSSKLKNMSAEEIKASEYNRILASSTLQVRNAMNEAQKAMGNFSLNVGNYRSAFDGLGFSIQQVMREVPSAINVQQFFLAISNNIPMVADQLKLFKEEQANIRREMDMLAQNNRQNTEEYIKLENKKMSVSKKVWKSIANWQTGLILIILALRKYGAEVIDFIMSKFKKMTSEMRLMQERAKMFADSVKSYGDSVGFLITIQNKLKDVAEGSDDYKKIIEEINDKYDTQIDKLTTSKEKVIEITQKLKEQAWQIAKNNAVMDLVGQQESKRLTAEMAKKAIQSGNFQQLKELGGFEDGDMTKIMYYITQDIAGKDWSEDEKGGVLYEAFSGISDALSDNQSVIFKIMNFSKNAAKWLSGGMLAIDKYEREKGKKMLEELLGSNALTQEQIEQLINDEYNPLGVTDGGDKDKSKKAKIAKYEDLWKEMMRVRYNLIADEREREVAKENDYYEITIKENKDSLDEKIKNLEEYAKQNKWTDAQIADEKKKIKDQADVIEKASEKEHLNNLMEIHDRYEKMRIDRDIDATNVILKERKKKIRSTTDEKNSNAITLTNISMLKDRVEELKKIDTSIIQDDSRRAIAEKELQDEIAETNSLIEKQRNLLDYSKTMSNFSGMSDLLGSDRWLDMLSKGDSRGFLGRMYGIDEEEMAQVSDGQIESMMETWNKNATEAISKWKDITIDSLGQVLDAYVDFYQAKADAAAEDTDKAKEAYELQKSLLEQGYANSVGTAWAEYQQKQQIQKKAEEDVKNAEKIQKAADSASTASNLIVASSNILKQFAANPIIAGILLSTMWGSFAAAKVMAYKASKYEDGGYEELTGGSHASGHDINLGVMNGKGRSMVAEGGESIGIFSRKAKRKYGSQTIADIVNSINNGTYEKTTTDRLNDNVAISVKPYRSTSVNLSRIETTLDSIDRNGKSSSYIDGEGNRVIVNGNAKTTYIKR